MTSEPLRIQDAGLTHHTRAALRLLAQHEAAESEALQLAIACGAELLEVKANVGHGGWLDWLNGTWPRSVDVAEEFMLLALPANAAFVATLAPGTSRRAAAEQLRDQKRVVRVAKARAAQPEVSDDPDDRWTAEVGDARHLPLEDNSAGCVIFSPPYNARLDYEGYEDWKPWDEWWDGLIVPAIVEAARVLRPGGRLCLNLANVVRSNVGYGAARRNNGHTPVRFRARGGKKWSPPGAGGETWAYLMAPKVWAAIAEVGLLEREQLTWVKADSEGGVTTTSTAWGSWCSPLNPVMRGVTEPVFIADKGSHSNPSESASDLTEDEFKAWTRSVWFIPNEGGTISRWGAHPAPFPVELPRRLAKLYSWPGDLVVDPFMGLAATGEAALRVGRRFLGVDISPVYVERSRARLEAVSRELSR